MHPWHGVGHLERIRRWDEMRSWLKENKHLRIKRGTTREDGRRFLGYGTGYENGENWTAPDAFERRDEHARNSQRKRRKSPEHKAKFNEYIRNRYANKARRLEMGRARSKKHRTEKPWMNAQKTRRRYAVKKARMHPDLNHTSERALFEQAARLARETGVEHHVDHIIPLKHGGWHHHDNLQVLPGPVNLEKGTNPLWYHPGYKSWRDVPEHLWPEQMRDTYQRLILRSA
jgi:hypothetical protein